MEEKQYFTTSELKSYMEQHPHTFLKAPCLETIRRWVRDGKIPTAMNAGKKGVPVMFSKTDIDKWQKNNRQMEGLEL